MRTRNRRILRYGLVALAAAGVLAGGRKYTQHWVKRSIDEFPPIGRFLTIENTEIHYVRAGRGQPIVCIHGLGGLMQDFTSSVFDSLTQRYNVTVFDRPGYGYSTLPDDEEMSLPAQARLTHELIIRLGIVRPLIIGHSYGGAVALQYALDYPRDLSGLVLIAPAAYPVTRWAGVVGRLAGLPVLGKGAIKTLAVPLGELVAPQTVRHAFAPNPVPPGHMEKRILLSNRPSQFLASMADMAHMNGDLEALGRRFGNIAVPVSIVTGDGDHLLDYKSHSLKLAEQVPGASITVLPGSGHMVQFVYPDEVLRVINQSAAFAFH